MPRPRKVTTCAGAFPIYTSTRIVIEQAAARPVAERLARWLGVAPDRVRALGAGEQAPLFAISLTLESPAAPARDPGVEPPRSTSDEGYTVDVDSGGARLRGRSPAGLFYAAQTLAQLVLRRPLEGAPPAQGAQGAMRAAPCVHIEDAPRVAFRAMHLDVARHFFSREIVERYVDLLSLYRFNVFHWHLTDDQGFRLEVRSHPELTQVGARRREADGTEHAGHYTQAEARAVVAYAKERFVTVVPEIEMPGHARAILAAHPELSCTGKKQEVPSTWGVFDDVLCAGNPATYALVDDVLRETTEVFPSRYVHVGGDEVPTTRWKACPKCRAAMEKEKVSVEGLEGVFLKRATATLETRGRRAMAWDDAIGGGLATNAIAVAWRGGDAAARAAARGYDVVSAPSDAYYFNFWQSRSGKEAGHEGFIPWTRVLATPPVPPGLDAATASRVLGGEGALWTEYVKTPGELDALLLPRLGALAEALWSGASDERDFARRFGGQREVLDAGGVAWFVEPPSGLRPRQLLLGERDARGARDARPRTLTFTLPSLHPDGVVRYTLDGSEPTPRSPAYAGPIPIAAPAEVAARLFLPGGKTSAVVRGRFERAPLSQARPLAGARPAVAGVKYKYFEGDFRRLPDFATATLKQAGTLTSLAADAPGFRAERYAVEYEALFDAPVDGIYRFVASADDGVAVEIDGARVLEDDGEHAARDAEGEAALARGLHTVRILYFQGGGGRSLSLRCEAVGAGAAASAAAPPCPLALP